ncbi:MAG: hypothetical protein AB7V44_28325 [Pseudonocardia sp.]
MSPPGVKHALTANHRNRVAPARHTRARRDVVENDDYAAFTRRILAAHGRRIAHGDIEGLAALAHLAQDIDTALHTAIDGLRAAGYSWADIADRLGITRQAAHQRWGHRS